MIIIEELIETEDVFDITVPETHCFFGDGILVHNCVEVGFYPYFHDENGNIASGWQACNLTEINGLECDTEEKFFENCEVGSILGTLQAGYTNFKFISDISKKIIEREALLGVSLTGWMNNPKILFNRDILKKGAEIVKETNKKVASIIGINQSARTTCVKPAGSTSTLLMTASGIHGEHAPRYLRHQQMNKETDVAKFLMKTNPAMLEESAWSANKTDYVAAFPCISNKGSIFKSELLGVKQLEYVKLVQESWVENGTNQHLCVDSRVRHNVSNTIQVDNWNEVKDYIWENKHIFAGISLIGESGDKDYVQAPFTEVLTHQQISKKYGEGAMFASGLIVDGLKAFNDNLWSACMTARGFGEDISKENSETYLKRDWVRRFIKFAKNYFKEDLKLAEYCIKDVYLLHKWSKIQRSFVEIDMKDAYLTNIDVDISTMGASACVGTKDGEGCLI